MESLGRHAIQELYGCSRTKTRWLKKIILFAAVTAGATIVHTAHGKAKNEGFFAEVTIAESHIMILVFPKDPRNRKISLEVFTCGKTIDPEKIIRILAKHIKHKFASKSEMFDRGVGVAPRPHKPAES